MNEFRTYGPPGTGKTTWLSRQIENAVFKHGSDAVFVSSFTKAAATELVSRNLPVPDSNVGTLHSHCFRALGNPQIAELHVKDFNEANPAFRLSGGKFNLDETIETGEFETPSDKLASSYQIFRNKMTRRDLWPDSVKAFARVWESWKNENDLLDFTDLVEICLRDAVGAPNQASIGFIDECQDLTPLQLALVRKWGQGLDYFILVGDEDQCIYGFCGATPDVFLNPPVPDDHKIVLGQSYRIPARVHALAVKWISKVKEREPKEYKPRDYLGDVRYSNATYRNPKVAIEEAKKYVADGKTVMFLTACAYQTTPLVAILRDEGIPFHNPFRAVRGDWNPLLRRKGLTSSDRLLAYLGPTGPEYDEGRRLWTPQEIKAWSEVCRSRGLFLPGAKAKIIEAVEKGHALDPDDWAGRLGEIFHNFAAFQDAMKLSDSWFESQLKPEPLRRMKFPLKILRKHGGEALREPPSVVVGTIHSVKGGEADVVFLFPDISMASYRAACESTASRDAVVRQFYVGMTRCRESLVVCNPATNFCAKGISG